MVRMVPLPDNYNFSDSQQNVKMLILVNDPATGKLIECCKGEEVQRTAGAFPAAYCGINERIR